METLTEDQFKQRYGMTGLMSFKDEEKEQGLFDALKSDFAARGEENARLLSESGTSPMDSAVTGLKVAANTAGGVSDAVGETLKRTPVIGGVVEKAGSALKSGFNKVTDKLSGIKFFQEAAAGLEPGNKLEKGLEGAAAGGEIAGTILGADVGAGVVKQGAKVPGKVAEGIPKPNLSGIAKNVAGAVRDVTPTSQSFIDHQLAKALDMTSGDLKNIESNTGNQVGKWLSENNLIGTNKATTQGLVSGFFQKNYEAVRNEIAKVKTNYERSAVPRYEETLKAIQLETSGKLGLEKTNNEIATLLKKETVSLEDVQRVKELLDEHFNLYKMTGDVGQGAAKAGLANVRAEIKNFIEGQVQKETGADIRMLNNNVATARGVEDAIKARSQRGLTRANITWRDAAVGMGLTYFGSPIAGLAAVLVWKVLTSPTARLRMARYVDGLSDARKLKLSESIRNGEVPQEVMEVVKEPK